MLPFAEEYLPVDIFDDDADTGGTEAAEDSKPLQLLKSVLGPTLVYQIGSGVVLRTRWTIEPNIVVQQNLIGYPIANLKLNPRGEKESKIHIPSWKVHFVSHFCPEV